MVSLFFLMGLFSIGSPLAGLSAEDIVVDRKGREITIEALMQQHAGKLVYLDVWASWCRPCLQNMPAGFQLKKKMQGEPVSFIYISIDEDAASWVMQDKMLQQQGANDSYLLKKVRSSAFLRKNRITSIPRYFVFNRAGKMVVPNAPPPTMILQYDENYLKKWL